MSVEYHSSKETMKIRVWQLSDLLLPPRKCLLGHFRGQRWLVSCTDSKNVCVAV